MKSFLYIVICCWTFNLSAQNDSLNQTDSYFCKQGYWKIYKEHAGKTFLESEGRYSNSLKEGLWLEYYSNGIIKNRLEFKNGRPNGYAVTYHNDGSVEEEGTWIQNRWRGNYTSFYKKNHQPNKIYYFNENGKLNGHQISYHENGSILSESLFENGKVNISYSFYKDGTLAELIIKDSITETFYENGKKESVKYFVNGKQTTYTQIYYYENGKIAEESSFINNKKDGKHIIYYKNGKIEEESSFTNNKKDGSHITYYKNGKPKLKLHYKDGRMDGERMVYDKKGNPIEGKFIIYDKKLKEREGICIHGKPEGEILVYDTQSKLRIKANFKNGKPDGNTYYYRDDKVILTEKYQDGIFLEEVTKQ